MTHPTSLLNMNDIAEPPVETQALKRTDNSDCQQVVDSPPRRAPLIYSRIAACIGEIEAVGKDHRNQQQGYSFRAIDDFFDALQPVLARHRVFVTPTILSNTREERATKSGGVLMTTLTHVRFRVWTEDGSFVEADALGEGSDSGDKSANKSASQALKYLFMQVFCVRVNGEATDTERESPAYTQHAPQTPPSNRREYPVSNDRTYQKPAPQPARARPVATPANVLPAQATPKTLEWAWNALTAEFGHDVTWNFLSGKTWVNPESNDYTTWALEKVPTSKQAMAALADEIRKTIAPLLPENLSTIVDKNPRDDLPLEIANAIITVPRRGMKRDEYLKNPDTIGGLYAAMKGGDPEAQKRLWGMVKGWNPEPYVDGNGKKWPVKAEDAQCRIDLDLFADWYAQKHGESQQ